MFVIQPISNNMVGLEGIILSEMSEKDKYHTSSFLCGIRKKNKLIDEENRLVIARGGGNG